MGFFTLASTACHTNPMKYIVQVFHELELATAPHFSGTIAREELLSRYPFFEGLVDEEGFVSANVKIGRVWYMVIAQRGPTPPMFDITENMTISPPEQIEPFIGHRTEGGYNHPRPSGTDNRDRR